MKITQNAALIAVALTMGSAFVANAADVPLRQKAVLLHSELAPIGAPKDTKLPKFTVIREFGPGKHWAQMQEARRPSSNERSLDIVHAPRPITAGKDPNFDRKWRENAEAMQVAPLK